MTEIESVEIKRAFGCRGDTIRLRSGKYLDLLDPQPDQITLGDIACGLARQCRFGGQIESFYSVAEHSYHCARVALDAGLTTETQIAALMHDAAEAFICDLQKPLKEMISGYDLIESRIMRVIAEKFQIDFNAEFGDVKKIDRAMLIAERRRLFSADNEHWTGEDEVPRIHVDFRCWDYREAETMWSIRAKELGLSFAE